MRRKVDPFLFDLSEAGQRKHLKTAAVCQNGAIPPHEAVQAAQLPDHIIPGAHMEMVCIGKLDLASNGF